jgi:hypothetical protein
MWTRGSDVRGARSPRFCEELANAEEFRQRQDSGVVWNSSIPVFAIVTIREVHGAIVEPRARDFGCLRGVIGLQCTQYLDLRTVYVAGALTEREGSSQSSCVMNGELSGLAIPESNAHFRKNALRVRPRFRLLASRDRPLGARPSGIHLAKTKKRSSQVGVDERRLSFIVWTLRRLRKQVSGGCPVASYQCQQAGV